MNLAENSVGGNRRGVGVEGIEGRFDAPWTSAILKQ